MYQLRGLWWRAHAHERTRREVAPSVVLLDYRPFSATTSSTSIGEPQGTSTTPTAVRAWRPFSPKSSPIKSAAPFITSGWPVKPLGGGYIFDRDFPADLASVRELPFLGG
jgi:hypothetical protein